MNAILPVLPGTHLGRPGARGLPKSRGKSHSGGSAADEQPTLDLTHAPASPGTAGAEPVVCVDADLC